MRKYLFILISFCILTACWNNEEIDNNAFVHGLGIHKKNERLSFSMEIINPTETDVEGTTGAESFIIEKEGDTLLEAAREAIRDIKRRLHFEHNRILIISEALAKEKDFIHYLDPIRRDEMFRLNNFLFISEGNPAEILKTSTFYNDLTSTELVSALDQAKFLPGYVSVKMYDYFRAIEGPIPNTFIPIIKISEENEQPITTINGTAVIKNGKMVGKLTSQETIGLNALINRVHSGYAKTFIKDNYVTIEVKNSKAVINPILENENLRVHIDLDIVSTLADNTANITVDKDWISHSEKKFSNYIKDNVLQPTINKLQNELRTDITNIGIETYRKYPKEWKKIKNRWDDVFSNAEIIINVQTKILNEGLINKSKAREKDKPQKNPYKLYEK